MTEFQLTLWSSGKASGDTMARNSRPLNEQLTAAGETQPSVLLAIYEWMMGFPPGWLPTVAAPTGMRLSRKSARRRSPECSP